MGISCFKLGYLYTNANKNIANFETFPFVQAARCLLSTGTCVVCRWQRNYIALLAASSRKIQELGTNFIVAKGSCVV